MKSQLTENVRYLEDVATSILDAITQQTETEFDGVKKVEPVLVPTYDKYPSIWVRDVAMNAECGMIAPSLLKRHNKFEKT